MGLVKRLLYEPWLADNETVCGSCFEDQGIKSYIENHSDGVGCDFCKSEEKSLSFSLLIPFIHDRLHKKYIPLGESTVPYEGGYIFEGDYIGDLLGDLGLNIHNNTVQEKIENYLNNDNWIANDWTIPDNTYPTDWDNFCKYVKKKKRFFFNKTRASYIIETLKQLIKKKHLIKQLKPGTVFYRARAFKPTDSTPEYSIKDLGPPKSKDIMDKSSRMSPAGIPIFYCSNKPKIAVKEISDPKRKGYALIGKFKLEKAIYIIDFSKAGTINIPSYFDENASIDDRDQSLFLKEFPKEISKPIKKDGREHTEYVPTQIITEALKNLTTENKQKILGIGYKSAVGPGKSYALFFKRRYDDTLTPSSFLFLDPSFKKKVKMPYSP